MSSEVPPVPPVGSTIEHHVFGVGKITKIESAFAGLNVTIQFDRFGTKTLIWAFAFSKIVTLKGP